MATTATTAATVIRSTAAEFDQQRRLPAWALPLSLSLVAAALGIFRLGSPSLWLDEAITVGVAQAPFGEFVGNLDVNGGNMIVYYGLLHGWVRLGLDEWFVRLPSVIFAVGTIPVLFRLTSRIAGRSQGVIAAVLLTASVPFVQYAQEARSYSLFLLLTVAGWLLLVEAVERRSTPFWIGYVAVAALSLYAHYYAALFVAAQLSSLLLVPADRLSRRRLLATATAIGALTLPLLLVATSRDANWPAWIPPMDWTRSRELAEFVVGGVALPWAFLTVALAAAGVAFSLAVAVTHRRSIATWHALIPTVWLVLPVGTALAATVLSKPFLVPRYLLPCTAAIAVLVAQGLNRLPPLWRVAGVGTVLVMTAPFLAAYYTPHSEDWRGATSYVMSGSEQGDGIVMLGESRHPVEYYWQLADKPDDMPTAVYPSGSWQRTRRTYLKASDGEAVARALRGHERVWVVEWGHGPGEDEVIALVKETMHLMERKTFRGSVEVSLYRRP